LAESTSADFSQTLLKISYVSLMVLDSLHSVAKCGVASDLLAFMGRLSPVSYRLAVPAHHAENVMNFGFDKMSMATGISPFFTKLYQLISQLLGVQSKYCKSKKRSG
jgi:hypothetical protein